MPDEVKGLETADEPFVLCEAAVSDTRQLAPVSIQYAPGVEPPTLVAQPAGQPDTASEAVSPEVLSRITLQADTFFDFDRSNLKPEGERALDDVVAQVSALRDWDVVIVVGHTDHTGTHAYNQGLSERRAASVKTYLVGRGMDASRIQAEGRGKTQPIASNATREGRAQNRRVEIEIVGRQTSRAGSAGAGGGDGRSNNGNNSGGGSVAPGWR